MLTVKKIRFNIFFIHFLTLHKYSLILEEYIRIIIIFFIIFILNSINIWYDGKSFC